MYRLINLNAQTNYAGENEKYREWVEYPIR